MNEFFELESVLGDISESDVTKIIKFAKQKNTSCLGFISTKEDTVFNKNQVMIIKREITEISEDIDKGVLKIINDGISIVNDEIYTYLLFEVKNDDYKENIDGWKSFHKRVGLMS